MKTKPRAVRSHVRGAKPAVHRRGKATLATAEDARALGRAKAQGLAPAELLRPGLQIAAAPFYGSGARPPRTRLFISSDPKLGEEDHLFKNLED